MTAPNESLASLTDVDQALYRLLLTTLRHEKLLAERDRAIALIQRQYATGIENAAADKLQLEGQVETYCTTHKEHFPAEKKSIQLAHGLVGLKSSPPTLQPLDGTWTWEKIEKKLRAIWKSKYFHKPKPPGIDKVKLKKELSPEQMKKCGLKVEAAENFYFELNRLALSDNHTDASDAAA